ncbi:MAG: thymidine phosphorylase [Deltaproteobacteria bacterium]|nr:thymidine phosphorylase [Deltaproteobacteria bacterium]
MTTSLPVLLEHKRDGGRYAAEEIEAFVRAVVDGRASRAQAAAWLAFAYVRGLDDGETAALTRAMATSGRMLSWEGLDGPFVDKHSTGGVGDKVSLVLAPLWAELGRRVPMVSGRGLGHTGGTLDKLEAIPGYRCDLEPGRLRRILEDVGCFVNGQTDAVAPADRILYALRNETGTVPSIPLITASILSKKLAEGISDLVLDVKVGSGAFMPDLDAARALARSIVRVGRDAKLRVRALITDMDQPLGQAVGNALEVREAVDALKGEGPDDLVACTLALAGDDRAGALLASGAAFERFRRMVAAHGGDPESLDRLGRTTDGIAVVEVRADRSGFLQRCDALGVGRAAFALGAGRSRASDAVHPDVGVVLERKRGDPVAAGEVLARVHHAGRELDTALACVRAACVVGDAPPGPVPLVRDVVDLAI